MSRNSTLQMKVRLLMAGIGIVRCGAWLSGYLTRMPGWAPESGDEQEEARRIAGRRQHHAFRHAELHLARREVGDHHGQAADERRRIVGRLDAGEHLARAERADVERQLQQLVRAFDMLGVDDVRDAQVDLGEVVDADEWRAWVAASTAFSWCSA